MQINFTSRAREDIRQQSNRLLQARILKLLLPNFELLLFVKALLLLVIALQILRALRVVSNHISLHLRGAIHGAQVQLTLEKCKESAKDGHERTGHRRSQHEQIDERGGRTRAGMKIIQQRYKAKIKHGTEWHAVP